MDKLSCFKISYTSSIVRKHLLLIMLLCAVCYGCKKQCVTCVASSFVYRNDSTIALFYDSALHRYDTLTKIDTINREGNYSILSICPGNPDYNKIYPVPAGTNFSGLGYTDPLGNSYGCFYNQ